MSDPRTSISPPVVLLPAAGRASRLGALPCSKELLPLGFRCEREGISPKPVSEHLLEQCRDAGLERAVWVLRQSKEDIPAYYGSGLRLGLELAYLYAKSPHGVPDTLVSARAFLRGERVLLGLPDILYPAGAVEGFLNAARARDGQEDVVLALFPALEPERSDLVRTDAAGRVLELRVKDPSSDLRECWGLALWSEPFGDFLESWVTRRPPDGNERQLGAAFLAARAAGLRLGSVRLGAPFFDIGTPAGYRRALAEV